MKTLFRALLLGFAVTAYAYTDEALADQIVDLPGAPDVSFNQFAGYLTVDENTVRFRVIASTLPQPYPSSVNRCETGQEVLGPSHVRSLALLHRPLSPRSALRPLTLAPPLLQDLKYFYWFAEREGGDPASSPLAMWTNGGPGCSGLSGFMTEQGPFRPQADGTLKKNDYAWNKVANYLFIEQPVGVGFSYSTTPSDYLHVGDLEAAAYNYNLLLAFVKRFPEYATNPLYITAESYGTRVLPPATPHYLHHTHHRTPHTPRTVSSATSHQ